MSIFKRTRSLSRRKGGGGHGSGHGSEGSVASTGKAPAGHKVTAPNLLGGKSVAVTYSNGGGKSTKVTRGAFKGRLLGGGTRSEVYGTSAYGSGYPGRPYDSRGVAGQPFPYYYYPVVWGDPSPTTSYPPYLNATAEYGEPANASRPGGALMEIPLHSNTTDSIFQFLADNSTVYAMLPIIRASCSTNGHLDNNTSPSTPLSYTGMSANNARAVDAIQYFRASSAVLTLNNYNDLSVLSTIPKASPKPLPATTDLVLMRCLNLTIGSAIPLVNAKTTLNKEDLALIVLFSIIGLAIVASVISSCFVCAKLGRRRQEAEEDSIKTLTGTIDRDVEGQDHQSRLARSPSILGSSSPVDAPDALPAPSPVDTLDSPPVRTTKTNAPFSSIRSWQKIPKEDLEMGEWTD